MLLSVAHFSTRRVVSKFMFGVVIVDEFFIDFQKKTFQVV